MVSARRRVSLLFHRRILLFGLRPTLPSLLDLAPNPLPHATTKRSPLRSVMLRSSSGHAVHAWVVPSLLV